MYNIRRVMLSDQRKRERQGFASGVYGLGQKNRELDSNILSAAGMTLAVLVTLPYLATRPGGLSTTALAIIVIAIGANVRVPSSFAV